MKLFEFRELVARLPDGDDLDIVVRCEWIGKEADETPDGNCFALRSLAIEHNHVTGDVFLAIDCDQEPEDGEDE